MPPAFRSSLHPSMFHLLAALFYFFPLNCSRYTPLLQIFRTQSIIPGFLLFGPCVSNPGRWSTYLSPLLHPFRLPSSSLFSLLPYLLCAPRTRTVIASAFPACSRARSCRLILLRLCLCALVRAWGEGGGGAGPGPGPMPMRSGLDGGSRADDSVDGDASLILMSTLGGG